MVKDSHIFSLILLPENIKIFIQNFLLGLLELTNGIINFANLNSKHLSFNIIICSFLLGFGGISVMLQSLSFLKTSNISAKPYLLGKIFQGCFAITQNGLFYAKI